MTHLLIATKQLLETLTQWSRKNASESEVSDVYVRLGYEFNIACRAFTSIGVETSDLGPVPDLLRNILEDTLSQDASAASLDKFLPRIRDIIINLLHGLKRKQTRLRARQAKENSFSGNNAAIRQPSIQSNGSNETSLTQMLEDVPSTHNPSTSSRAHERRNGSGNAHTIGDHGVPPRSSSVQDGVASPMREERGFNIGSSSSQNIVEQTVPSMSSGSSLSSGTMQDLPVLSPEEYRLPIQRMSMRVENPTIMAPPPPPPPKQQDALAQLQRGGELERRASRRYSQYQISKQLGATPNGLPVIPPSQNSPIPNRNREVRESLKAVRTRGAALPNRQRSARYAEASPTRGKPIPRHISEERGVDSENGVTRIEEDSPVAKTPEEKYGGSYLNVTDIERPMVSATMNGPPTDEAEGLAAYDTTEDENVEAQRSIPPRAMQREDGISHGKDDLGPSPVPGPVPTQQFIPDQSPQPEKELTLFLQYKSKIKKHVLPDGAADLSIARLQLAFIDRFAWNTHSNGIELPEIYIQDPVSGVRHELEDLSDVKDRSVLVLNVEALDEVKRHFDDGLGDLRKIVEGVRSAIDGQQSSMKQVTDLQQDAAKNIARLTVTSQPITNRTNTLDNRKRNGTPVSASLADSSNQLSEIQRLRRDLAVVKQTFSSFTSDIGSSMVNIRAKAASIKTTAAETSVPNLDNNTGRAYVNAGKKTVGEESERIVNRVDDLQDSVEDLRKDVVSRGVRPLPRLLEGVSKEISVATADLKKMQEYVKREKPVWTKIWEKELEVVCNDREFLTMQEDLVADLEDDLEKATQTFALVEQATKQQNIHAAQTQGGPGGLRSISKGLTSIGSDQEVDPIKAKDGVLGEVRALQPNHETRLEAIERAEKARQKELEGRREGAFKKELGTFVDESKLRKSGGVEEAERLRKAKDDRLRREGYEKQREREANKAKDVQPSAIKPEAALSPPDSEGVIDSPEAQYRDASEELPNELAKSPTDMDENGLGLGISS